MSADENSTTHKPILYFDMDNVLVDFQSGVDKLPKDLQTTGLRGQSSQYYNGRAMG